ncbi:non-homologous end-joining DNA ligase [Fictibacillus macauensis]|uniref:non-homologous end-joining DNA ligase n=1 Tax=Fictibacillus macauensis TaxID=245160 RepID=UPI000316BF37|nr:non-homologous end-joining DNA ligase [Fictibacillus macauensis]
MGTHQQKHELRINGVTLYISSLEKPLWPKQQLFKADYLQYLTTVAPYMLPFLKNRPLTSIRYPHGTEGERFFQKNCPDYAPDFIQTALYDNKRYIVCNTLQTLLWLGNQLVLEMHIPFHTSSSCHPSEIVIDLDPPDAAHFSLAVEAALLIYEVCQKLQLSAFVKTSGNKGMQVYIPLPEQTFTFDDTRLFTTFLAHYLLSKQPTFFTIERLKKNRGNKCYIDYIQHAYGKTIIAPYSTRGNEEGLVATPLYWNELTSSLKPTNFPLASITERLKNKGDPFATFLEAKKQQPFAPVLAWLQNEGHGLSL